MATMVLRRGWMMVFVIVLLIGGVVVGMMWWLQRQLLYFPDGLSVSPAGTVIEGARDVTLHTDDGLELGVWFVPAAPGSDEADRQMAVLVALGNGGNRVGRADIARPEARLRPLFRWRAARP